MPLPTDLLPGEHNLEVVRGNTWSQRFEFELNDVALVLPVTGWACQARKSSGTLVATIDVDAVEAPDGVIILSIPSTTATTLPVGDDLYYDLELREPNPIVDDPELVYTLVTGRITVWKDWTRGE